MDHRLFRRRSSIIDFPVYQMPEHAFIGRLGDISEGGLQMYGEVELERNGVFDIAIEYRDADGSMMTAEFEATAVWTGRDKNPALYSTGFRINHLEKPMVRARLDHLMGRYTVSILDDEPEED